jgi:hypothetical protein
MVPIIDWIPTLTNRLSEKFGTSTKIAAVKLLADSKNVGDQKSEDKSILGVLRTFRYGVCPEICVTAYPSISVKDTDLTAESHSHSEEVVAQVSESSIQCRS